MARRRTKRDAIDTADCRFASPFLPAMTEFAGAQNVRGSRPIFFNTFAPQRAEPGLPVRRLPSFGARVRGVNYGNQENAGGCHPPGRNTDCRYSR
jgi:hypothetical protein